jgi:hypothetical protein
MMHKVAVGAVAIALCLAVVWQVNEAAQSDRSQGLAVVQFAEKLDSATVEQLRKSVGAVLVSKLSRTGAEVWRIDSKETDAVTALRGDSRVRFVETIAYSVATAVPSGTVSIDTLSASEQTRVRALTGRLSSADYLITDMRPAALNADLLDVAVGDRVGLPLPSGKISLFSRDRIDRSANGDLTWLGREVDGQGDAMLVVRPIGITGVVHVGGEAYSVLPLGDGRQLIKRDIASQFPGEHPLNGR